VSHVLEHSPDHEAEDHSIHPPRGEPGGEGNQSIAMVGVNTQKAAAASVEIANS
jgi:hypothetical protein